MNAKFKVDFKDETILMKLRQLYQFGNSASEFTSHKEQGGLEIKGAPDRKLKLFKETVQRSLRLHPNENRLHAMIKGTPTTNVDY